MVGIIPTLVEWRNSGTQSPGEARKTVFRLLGPLELTKGNVRYTPTAHKVRQVLAILVSRSNRVVGIDSIIEELWHDRQPRTAWTTTQTYIYQLRKLFDELGMNSGGEILVTRAPGYVLEVPDSEIDVRMFDGLVRQGRALIETGRTETAVHVLRKAEDLWSGPALSNMSCGPLLESYTAHLEEMRIDALELRVSAEMRLGHHRELIAELRSLIKEHSLNEWLHAQLITALSRSGRRGEALRAYRELRLLMNTELGLEPSVELQRVHQDVLAADAEPVRLLQPL
ncbi:AfsR/SARP family transcriptional regulator [Amycolatopsis sp. NPDC049688]|uniref:AfsR/SARP family transcriptional regulator n=1 Tax=Amycolatopsis sp. NPDC049688 TaxID=3154733 RepID=UPI003435E634